MNSNYYKKLLIHNNVDINETVSVLSVYNFSYREIVIQANYKNDTYIVRKNLTMENVKYPLDCLIGYIDGLYHEIARLIEEKYSLNYDFEQ